jgi:penicillin-binding protein 1A
MSTDKKNETKRIKTSELNKKAKKKTKPAKGKKVKFKDKHPKASKAIKIAIVVILLLLIIGAGILVGAFWGIFGDELKISEDMLVVGYENSTVYDADGNLIATLSGGTKRKSISLSEMSEYLPKAYVAIEDERFYTHSGIDIGRTAYATITYVLHGGKSSFGGSTITQQVIKNITKEKDNTAFAGALRKIKEMSKAIQVERYLSKDQILELYLNLIFTAGNDINGVELGSIYYFNKSAKDLSIAECAYMAGINHSPNSYKPFSDFSDKEDPAKAKEEMTEKINKRTKTVLAKMKELDYITKEQYDEAIAEVDNGLKFENGEGASVTTDVSYVTEAALDQIRDQIMEENEDMDESAVEMYLYSSGLKIYTTQKTDIQTVLEEEISKDIYSTYYTEKDKETGEDVKYYSIPTMTIIDHTTGQVVAAATASGDPDNRTATTKIGYFNYPTKNKKQTGSCMKPIAVIAPGLETGKITGATVFYDAQTTWGSGANAYTPKDYAGYSNALMNMRNAIRASVNVPHVKALSIIGTEAAVNFCESVGLPRFEEEGLSLALGGLQDGVSTLQMAGAYAAIANGGTYITPTFYTKVTDSSGNILYEPNQEKNRVMSEQNAYIEKSILTEPVVGASGPGGNSTASYCAIKGMDVAAKTGTTNADYDRWLCGFTPYYTATCWYGYKDSHVVTYSKGLGGNPAGRIWDAVMTKIHENLPNAQFEEPEGIVRATVCKSSGLLATDACGDNVYQEVFTDSSVPKEYCEGHATIQICQDSGLLSAGACPNVTTTYQYLPEYERNAKWTTVGLENMASTIPTEYCTIHQGGGTSYVTEEDQVKFQAATDAAALGLIGTDADNYVNQKLEEWRKSKQNSQTSQQQTQQSQNTNSTSESTSGGTSSSNTTASDSGTSSSNTTASDSGTSSSNTTTPDSGTSSEDTNTSNPADAVQ